MVNGQRREKAMRRRDRICLRTAAEEVSHSPQHLRELPTVVQAWLPPTSMAASELGTQCAEEMGRCNGRLISVSDLICKRSIVGQDSGSVVITARKARKAITNEQRDTFFAAKRA